MISKRLFSFLLLLVSFGLFIHASPVIKENGISVRSLVPDAPSDLVEHLERRGCGCPQDIKDALLTLQANIAVYITQLNGINPCGPIIDLIIVQINIAITVILKITITDCTVTVVINECVTIIVSIIVDVCKGLLKYLILDLTAAAKFSDACVALIKACGIVCPIILGVIKTKLIGLDVITILISLCLYLAGL